MASLYISFVFFFFQAEDGIRDIGVTGVQTCALFFSSRRRHTRYWRDWSSDVCSSDLDVVAPAPPRVYGVLRLARKRRQPALHARSPSTTLVFILSGRFHEDRKSVV